MRSVFVNPERCIGCLQCELACSVEHSTSQDERLAFLERPVPRRRIHVQSGTVSGTAFPNRCRHCNPAPCLNVCPTGAITADEELGVVLVNPKRCIGCAMCAIVCPFDVITFYPLQDGPGDGIPVAVKCDGCIDRLLKGQVPACTEICKVDALVFGELNDLIAAGRVRETRSVLSWRRGEPTPSPGGDPLAPMRSFGEARLSVTNAAAEYGRSWSQVSPRADAARADATQDDTGHRSQGDMS